MTHEEPMDWMFERELEALGLRRKVEQKRQPEPAGCREPRDVSWYHRGEECPH